MPAQPLQPYTVSPPHEPTISLVSRTKRSSVSSMRGFPISSIVFSSKCCNISVKQILYAAGVFVML